MNLSYLVSVRMGEAWWKHKVSTISLPTDLHPEEEFALGGLELEDVDPPRGALRDMLELHIIREDDQILPHNKGEKNDN